MEKINIFINNQKYEAELNDSKIAEEIFKILPIETKGNLWGNEIYFEIGVEMENENPTEDLEIGDLTYWPEGDSFCIFYGETPVSIDEKPRPASPVTIIGKIKGNLEELRQIDRAQIKIVRY